MEEFKELNDTVCSFLRQIGNETVGCIDGSAAYDALYGEFFDLIVSDIMMPKVDGFEFDENVRNINQEIPILFMTDRDDLSSKQRGYRAGIDDYFVKPFELDELVLRIGALLRRAKITSSKELTVCALKMNTEERTAVFDGDKSLSLPANLICTVIDAIRRKYIVELPVRRILKLHMK